jgi:hypothetical protein
MSNSGATAIYVQTVPPSTGGDDTALIQRYLDAAETAGGGRVQLRAGMYRHTGLTIGSMVALVGDTEGGTILRQNASANHAIQSRNYAALLAANNSQSTADGTPYAIRIENVRLECNGASNTGVGHGIALWAFRVTMRNVYIYNTKGDGINWGGKPGTTTGNYPAGQVESIMENVWVRLAGGVGINYYGPNDAYGDKLFIASAAGVGLQTLNMDYGYVHIYGCLQGAVLNGNTRITHLETENNINEGLVTNSSGSQTNYIGRLTAYQNWTSGTATSANYSILLNGTLNIGDVSLNTTTGSGIYLSTTADNSTFSNAKVTSASAAGGVVGIKISASYVNITATVSTYSTGILCDFNHSNGRHIQASLVGCALGFYENGASSGSFYRISFNALSAGHTPWTLNGSSRSYGNFVSYGSLSTHLEVIPT